MSKRLKLKMKRNSSIRFFDKSGSLDGQVFKIKNVDNELDEHIALFKVQSSEKEICDRNKSLQQQ